MGCNYYVVKKKPTIAEPLHIGKSSMGWKFLFHDIDEYNVKIHTYPQWEKFLMEHCRPDGDSVILNEYDAEINVHEFLEMVAKKQVEDSNPDEFNNCKDIDGYRFADGEFSQKANVSNNVKQKKI